MGFVCFNRFDYGSVSLSLSVVGGSVIITRIFEDDIGSTVGSRSSLCFGLKLKFL